MRGFFVGSFLLIALEVFVSGKGPDKAAGLIGWTADGLDYLISADVPGIPQLAQPKDSTSKPSSSSSTVPGSGTGLAAITA